ncbi:hypothetical protein PUN28_015071 [Cardiocondyla obscurior]|uniref:Uncharacterized protein n=1 Tax=Cardiocondyla obscurior TaxID=286306 RepID=A0AAW2F1C3_9HYME
MERERESVVGAVSARRRFLYSITARKNKYFNTAADIFQARANEQSKVGIIVNYRNLDSHATDRVLTSGIPLSAPASRTKSA